MATDGIRGPVALAQKLHLKHSVHLCAQLFRSGREYTKLCLAPGHTRNWDSLMQSLDKVKDLYGEGFTKSFELQGKIVFPSPPPSPRDPKSPDDLIPANETLYSDFLWWKDLVYYLQQADMVLSVTQDKPSSSRLAYIVENALEVYTIFCNQGNALSEHARLMEQYGSFLAEENRTISFDTVHYFRLAARRSLSIAVKVALQADLPFAASARLLLAILDNESGDYVSCYEGLSSVETKKMHLNIGQQMSLFWNMATIEEDWGVTKCALATLHTVMLQEQSAGGLQEELARVEARIRKMHMKTMSEKEEPPPLSCICVVISPNIKMDGIWDEHILRARYHSKLIFHTLMKSYPFFFLTGKKATKARILEVFKSDIPEYLKSPNIDPNVPYMLLVFVMAHGGDTSGHGDPAYFVCQRTKKKTTEKSYPYESDYESDDESDGEEDVSHHMEIQQLVSLAAKIDCQTCLTVFDVCYSKNAAKNDKQSDNDTTLELEKIARPLLNLFEDRHERLDKNEKLCKLFEKRKLGRFRKRCKRESNAKRVFSVFPKDLKSRVPTDNMSCSLIFKAFEEYFLERDSMATPITDEGNDTNKQTNKTNNTQGQDSLSLSKLFRFVFDTDRVLVDWAGVGPDENSKLGDPRKVGSEQFASDDYYKTIIDTSGVEKVSELEGKFKIMIGDKGGYNKAIESLSGL